MVISIVLYTGVQPMLGTYKVCPDLVLSTTIHKHHRLSCTLRLGADRTSAIAVINMLIPCVALQSCFDLCLCGTVCAFDDGRPSQKTR